MRKNITLILLCLLFLGGCKQETQYGFVHSDVNTIINKTINDESFLVMISNSDCYSCDVFIEDNHASLQKDEIIVYTLNYSTLSLTDVDRLEIALGSYTTWPVVFSVVEGSVLPVNKYEYSRDAEGWQAWLLAMGIIKE